MTLEVDKFDADEIVEYFSAGSGLLRVAFSLIPKKRILLFP